MTTKWNRQERQSHLTLPHTFSFDLSDGNLNAYRGDAHPTHVDVLAIHDHDDNRDSRNIYSQSRSKGNHNNHNRHSTLHNLSA